MGALKNKTADHLPLHGRRNAGAHRFRVSTVSGSAVSIVRISIIMWAVEKMPILGWIAVITAGPDLVLHVPPAFRGLPRRPSQRARQACP